MNNLRLTKALDQIPQAGSYSMCKWHSFEDDQKVGFWYFILTNNRLQYPGLYVDIHGRISSTFLLDPTLKSLDVQALFTFDEPTLDVTSHFVGHGKLHLPGIANSSGMKYGIVDIELSVAQFISHLPTGQCPVVQFKIDDKVVARALEAPQCDCGGKTLGYRDDELHGHGPWCKLVTNARQT